MKLFAYIIAALTLVSTGLAVEVKKQVIITYPSETPDSVVQNAKDKITESGGVITHSYDLIKYVENGTFLASTIRRLLPY